LPAVDTWNSGNGGPNAVATGRGSSPGLNLATYWQTIRKRWKLVSLVLFVVTGVVSVWTYRQPKIYLSSCSLIIDPVAPKVLTGVTDVVELGAGNYWANREFYETQRRIMTSKELAQRVIDRLGLASDPDFPFPGAGANAKVGVKRDLVAALLAETTIDTARDSRVASVIVEDRKPERAAQIANAIANTYIEGNLDHKLESANAASVWLGDQVVGLKDRLLDSERTLYEYRKKSKLLDVSLDARQSMNTQNVQTYTQKLADLRAKKIEIESSRKLILAARDNIEEQESLPEVRQNPVVQQLRVMHVELAKSLAEAETSYGDKHPKVDSLRRKLASVRQDYLSEISKILKEKENTYRAIEENERALNKLIERVKAEAMELAQLEVEYKPLLRENEDNQNLYKLLSQRQKETGLTGLIKTNNVRILDPAAPGKAPIKPRVVINMFVALLAGLALGFATAIVAEGLDNTVKNQEQAEALIGVPVLGLIPLIDEVNDAKLSQKEQQMRDLGVFHDTRSAAAEACRSIRTNLLFLSPDAPLKTLVVTSPGPREGKTTTAISLAVTMAQAGAKVLLVDTDLRRPRLHRAFGKTNEEGISKVIVGEGTLDQAVIHTEVPNLDLLTCGPLPPNPAELLHTKKFKEVMAECARRYDRVIYDSPPTSAVTDPVVIGNLADGVVLVIRAAYTTREAAVYARRQLTDAKAKIIGTIVNRVDRSNRYYNYYYSRYYRSYRYGYSTPPTAPSSSS
jgi:succinoglycan biosynthesis transport protein ExoP